jgi:hypothetical protein
MLCDERVTWSDLKSKGFVHVRNFLTDVEIDWLREDYSIQSRKPRVNGNYDVPAISQTITWRLERKMREVGDLVSAAAGVIADMSVSGNYFAIERGVDFRWHQDHESYFMFQQHFDYLNFYIPILKPDPQRTNLCLIPFDNIRARLPEYYDLLVGSGAKEFHCEDSRTTVRDDENNVQYALPMDIDELKVVPELVAGDLLLLRGDVIHRTQDTDTPRVAASFRRTRSTALVKQSRLLSDSPAKKRMMENNAALYEGLLACFQAVGSTEMTAKELLTASIDRQLRRAIERST